MTTSSWPDSLRPADAERQTPAPAQTASLPTTIACEVLRRIYRWSRSHLQLQQRLQRLQVQLAQLPRGGVGVPVKDLDDALDRRLAPLRRADCELVIADFDQDGGIASRFGAISGVPTISQSEFMPRTGCPVLLVDLDGRLGVRKEFGDSGLGRFVQELEALLSLEKFGCPVPRIMNVDWVARSITMTFVPGMVVRELLAEAGANIRDRDAADARYTRSVDKRRVRDGRALVPKVLSQGQIAQIRAALDSIHAAGFVVEDVKFGNIIIDAHSGSPVFVDLERALPVATLPRPLADHLRAIDLRKFREHFGDARGHDL